MKATSWQVRLGGGLQAMAGHLMPQEHYMISSAVALSQVKSEASSLNPEENLTEAAEIILKHGAVYQDIVQIHQTHLPGKSH